MKKFLKIISAVLVCQSAGIIGSLFIFSAIPTWYATLNKPFFNPPNWIFGPVWTILYTLMGISLFLIWEKGFSEKQNKSAVIIFLIHLIINAFWSIIFFGLKSLLFAFIFILLLWGMIVYLINSFYKIDKKAAYLLMPYLLWVSFASVLNFSIWFLNR